MWTVSPARRRVRSRIVWPITSSGPRQSPEGSWKRQGSMPSSQLEWVNVASRSVRAKTKRPVVMPLSMPVCSL